MNLLAKPFARGSREVMNSNDFAGKPLLPVDIGLGRGHEGYIANQLQPSWQRFCINLLA
jgi:hypothetical protein